MPRDPERSSSIVQGVVHGVVHGAVRGAVASAAPLAVLAALVAGCIHAPAVVIVDRKTAVEQQASGSFRGLEEELEQAGLAPRPAPLTAAQLGAAGVRREGLEAADQDDAGNDLVRADALLIKRCLGEALDGTLVMTLEPCTGTVDVPEVQRLIERVNLGRRQLWRWLAGQARGKTDDEVRAAWREIHLQGLVCGGQVQVAGGAWEAKRC
jgi:hypothetical protein